MSKQTLKFNDIVVNKKDFYSSKKAMPLNSVNTNNIVISYRVKHSDDSHIYILLVIYVMMWLDLCVLFYLK